MEDTPRSECCNQGEYTSLREEVERLSELLWGSRCIYCDEVVGKDRKSQDIADEVLKNHIKICPKHPLQKAEAEAKRYREALEKVANNIAGSPGDIIEWSEKVGKTLNHVDGLLLEAKRYREALEITTKAWYADVRPNSWYKNEAITWGKKVEQALSGDHQ